MATSLRSRSRGGETHTGKTKEQVARFSAERCHMPEEIVVKRHHEIVEAPGAKKPRCGVKRPVGDLRVAPPLCSPEGSLHPAGGFAADASADVSADVQVAEEAVGNEGTGDFADSALLINDGLGESASTSSHSPACDGQHLVESRNLRGINIQWPFSQLILQGAKTIETRTYALGHLNIAQEGEELWLTETRGLPGRVTKDALVGNCNIPQDPQKRRSSGQFAFPARLVTRTTTPSAKMQAITVFGEGVRKIGGGKERQATCMAGSFPRCAQWCRLYQHLASR